MLKVRLYALLIVAAMAAGCQTPGPPIRYVALKMPESIEAREVVGRRVAKRDYSSGITTAAPHVVRALEDLAKAEGANVLMFVQADEESGSFQISAAKTKVPKVAAPRAAVPAKPELPASMSAAEGSEGSALAEADLLDRPLSLGQVVGTLDRGSKVTLVRKMSNSDGHWWYVRVEGKSGWVQASQVLVSVK